MDYSKALNHIDGLVHRVRTEDSLCCRRHYVEYPAAQVEFARIIFLCDRHDGYDFRVLSVGPNGLLPDELLMERIRDGIRTKQPPTANDSIGHRELQESSRSADRTPA